MAGFAFDAAFAAGAVLVGVLAPPVFAAAPMPAAGVFARDAPPAAAFALVVAFGAAPALALAGAAVVVPAAAFGLAAAFGATVALALPAAAVLAPGAAFGLAAAFGAAVALVFAAVAAFGFAAVAVAAFGAARFARAGAFEPVGFVSVVFGVRAMAPSSRA